MSDDTFSETIDAWAGWRHRNRLRFALESAALDYDVKLHIIEERGLLRSEYVIRISGSKKDVSDFCDAAEETFGSSR